MAVLSTASLFTLRGVPICRLEGEMDSHLLENSLEQGSNRRNGINTKTMKTATGSFELETPRDRNGNFEPQLIKKR